VKSVSDYFEQNNIRGIFNVPYMPELNLAEYFIKEHKYILNKIIEERR
jgi:hypothetical protein